MPQSDPAAPDPADPLSVPHLRSGLGTRSLRGGAVTMLAQAAKTLLQFASVAVLARPLAPQAFCLVALVPVVMILPEQFTYPGLSTAPVLREQLTYGQLSGLHRM